MLEKPNHPLAPLVLALVLGDRAASSFRQSMIGGTGMIAVFRSNPPVASITGPAPCLPFRPLPSQFVRIASRTPPGGPATP